MDDTSLFIYFQDLDTSEEDVSEGFLLLEQKDWDPYTGDVTIGTMVNAIANMLFDHDLRGGTGGGTGSTVYGPSSSTSIYGTGDKIFGSLRSSVQGTRPVSVHCSVSANEELIATVYAYPSPSNLRFNIHTTHGRITSTRTVTDRFQEVILFRLSDSEKTSYPVYAMSNWTWLGDIYDNDGAIIEQPVTTFNGDTFSLGKKVYGSLKVEYSVKRIIYELLIPEDIDELDNKWDTVVYGIFDGGVAWVEVDGEESNSLAGTTCSESTSITSIDDDDEPEDPSKSNRYTKYSYCLQDIISDNYS